MTAYTLSFTAPREVTVDAHPVPDPGPKEVRVQTRFSAISSGTEGLLYRGEAPTELPADETIESLEGQDLSYPLSYGYAAVGRVTAVGADVSEEWLKRRVFAYNPHESHFLATSAELLPIPDGVSFREATLLANAETAVTFVMDGRPVIGERVAVFGQGVVGLLTTALLARTPLESLVTVDEYETRRRMSEAFGADRSVPAASDGDSRAESAEPTGSRQDIVETSTDLTYELTGNPDALDDAIATTGFSGRVIVGSWYGTRPVTLDLGGRFHRDRIEIKSSQVSTIAPRYEGRWSRERRHDVAWEWLERLDLESLFTHELPLDRAASAYRRLDERPEETVQVLFSYDEL